MHVSRKGVHDMVALRLGNPASIRSMARSGIGFLCALASASALAGTTVIDVLTEGSGDINKLSGEQNLNGAMVWNGSEWVVNNTWAHKFFVDTRTGDRLKFYSAHDTTVNGAPDAGTQASACAIVGGAFAATGYGNFYVADGFQGFTITRQAYTYAKGSAGGTYCYGAVEYVIQNPNTGKSVILKSRGVGGGTGQAYFDVYIEDESATAQTTAFRGDPAWFTYTGMTAQQAKLVSDTGANKTGDLPGAVTLLGSHVGDYYLDIGGGADLGPAGTGKSYELHTGPLSNAFTPLSPSYITGFEYKWMDDSGDLYKITVSPTLFKKAFLPLPNAGTEDIPLLTPIGMLVLGALLAAFGARCIRRRRQPA